MTYDVIVIGGGAAGLSAALVLARSRRSVVVIDAGAPRNAPSAHSHNYLTRDGIAPRKLVALGRAEVTGYGGQVRDATVLKAERTGGRFDVQLDDGSSVSGRRVLLATGVTDQLPQLDGIDDHWGTDVVHCPYCHGWEVRDRAIGVLASSPLVFHSLHMWRQLSTDVTLFLNDAAIPDEQQSAALAARGISVVDGAVAGLVGARGALAGVRMAAGRVVSVQALAIQTYAAARIDGLDGLGLTLAQQTMGEVVAGTYVDADPMTGAATDSPGVFVAGNTANPMETLPGSAASGVRVGALINFDLIQEDIRLALG